MKELENLWGHYLDGAVSKVKAVSLYRHPVVDDKYTTLYNSIADTLNDFYEIREDVPAQGDEYYHPSQVYYMCPIEEYYYRRVGNTRDPQPNVPLSKYADAGTAIHSHFQNNILGPSQLLIGSWECQKCFEVASDCKLPLKCSCGHSEFKYLEIKVLNEDRKILGHCDGILEVDGVRVMLEIKSKSPSKFKSILKPDRKERIQSSIYLRELVLDTVVFLFVDRDSYANKIAIIGVDNKELEKADSLITLVETSLREDTSPLTLNAGCRKCKNSTTYRAKNCKWNDDCFGGSVL